jgi:glycosyltransferase involved in cell wall biosynthesis
VTVRNSERPDPVVTVGMTSFNQPQLLRRAVESVLRQEYRPIELIVSDDASHPSVWPALRDLAQVGSASGCRIRYFRHLHNKGMSANNRFVFGIASGKYFVKLDHDDQLDDARFLTTAVQTMEADDLCLAFIGNNRGEGKRESRMRVSSDFFQVFPGEEYLEKYFVHDLRPSYGSTLIRRDLIDDGFDASFTLSRCERRRLGLEPDEGFSTLFFLAPKGRFAVSGIGGSVQGIVPNSLSRSKFWHDFGAENLAVTCLGMYADRASTPRQRVAIRATLYERFPLPRLRLRFLLHFWRHPRLIAIMFKSRFHAKFPRRRTPNLFSR